MFGKTRTKASDVKNVMGSLFPKLFVGKNLMHRVMNKGRTAAYEYDDAESMTLFVEKLVEWRRDGGYYNFGMKRNSNGTLESWAAQMELEVRLAET